MLFPRPGTDAPCSYAVVTHYDRHTRLKVREQACRRERELRRVLQVGAARRLARGGRRHRLADRRADAEELRAVHPDERQETSRRVRDRDALWDTHLLCFLDPSSKDAQRALVGESGGRNDVGHELISFPSSEERASSHVAPRAT